MSTATSPDIGSILSRLDRVERSQRRWRRAAIALAAVGALGGLVGWTASRQGDSRREVTTQRLIVNGPDGHPRAMMTGEGAGSSFFLYGPDKYQGTGGGGGGSGGAGGGANPVGGVGGVLALRPRMRFMIDETGSKIEMLDPDGKPRIALTLTAEGPDVKLLDAEGNRVTNE